MFDPVIVSDILKNYSEKIKNGFTCDYEMSYYENINELKLKVKHVFEGKLDSYICDFLDDFSEMITTFQIRVTSFGFHFDEENTIIKVKYEINHE